MPTTEDKSPVENGNRSKFTCIKAGASLVTHKPCFSRDSKLMFVAVDTSVRIYSTNTGECVNVFNNDQGAIIALFLNPENHLQLITVSDQGLVCYWDYDDAVLIREIPLQMRVWKCFSDTKANNLFVIGHKSDNADTSKRSPKFVLITLDFEKSTHYEKSFPNLPKPIIKPTYSMSHDRRSIAVADSNRLKIRHLENAARSTEHLISDSMKFTCVEWHPKGECLATGIDTGCVMLWHNYTENKPIRSKFHWHSLPVSDICFTISGNFFYSGGSECVLVKWNVGTGAKQFLPRMGMPICKISTSPDSSIISSSHSDNCIVLLNQNNDVLGVVQGLTRSHHWDEFISHPVPTGLLFEKHTSALVLNGKPGHLQFYNLREDKQIYNLDIVQENYIHAERNRKIYHLDVIRAAFNKSGDWLATVEYRNDHETTPEVRLKFWQYIEVDQDFSLNTSIEMPHEDIVNCLAFQPSGCNSTKLLAVTTSDDKSFRIWSMQTDKEDSWSCQSVGFYRDFKAGDASFAEDGSVLCVAFDCILSLWLPDDNVLRTTLSKGSTDPTEQIKKVEFGRGDCSHIVVCHTGRDITAWDTLSFAELWCVEFSCTYLVSDPNSLMMAAFGTDGDIFIFKPWGPNPVNIYKQTSGKIVIAAAFFIQNDGDRPQSNDQHSELYFMTSDQILYTLSDEESSIDQNVKIQKVFGQLNTSLTPFGLLMAEKHNSGEKQAVERLRELQNSKGKKIIEMVTNTPCHVLPPPAELFAVYLNNIMKQKEKKLEMKVESKSDSEKKSKHNLRQSDETLSKNIDNKRSDKTEISAAIAEEEALEMAFKEDYSWVAVKLEFKS